MRTNLSHRIRQLLRENPDGLSSTQILEVTNASGRNIVNNRLKSMPDAYIDRWEKLTHGYQAVWCVVIPPDNCPHPAKDVVAVRPRGRKDSGQTAQTKSAT